MSRFLRSLVVPCTLALPFAAIVVNDESVDRLEGYELRN
jgi:hypothetical protein